MDNSFLEKNDEDVQDEINNHKIIRLGNCR